MSWIDDQLSQGPVRFDGGMGTMLLSAGLRAGSCTELWNVERPEAVEAVHRAYVASGAQCLTTNTFGGSPLSLARHGLAERTGELNMAAVHIARRALAPGGRIVGDVGPFGGFLEPFGEATPREVATSFETQIEALVQAGVDAILVESMADVEESCLAIDAAKRLATVPVLATFTFQKQGGQYRTMMGSSPEAAAERALAAGADVVGANCGTDLTLVDYLELGKALLAASEGRPVLLQPNAGSPQVANGEVQYPASPEELGAWAAQAAQLGVRLLGGCCGTTPAHIAKMAAALGA